MLNKLTKRNLTLSLLAISVLLLLFSFSLLKDSLAAKVCCYHECNLTDPHKCNGNIVQTCGNCDTDHYNDWCDQTDCSTIGQVCFKGVCQLASSCTDNDGDGYDNCSLGQVGDDGKVKDCDDSKSFIHPAAAEICDGYDNDCNGQTDENCDKDNDNYCNCGQPFTLGSNLTAVCAGTNTTNNFWWNSTCDCNDNNLNVNRGAIENCSNSIDDDCDNQIDCTDTNCTGDPACGIPCTPNGCNANCPAGCTVAQDPDCGCQNGNGCCGIGCNNATDNDCCIPTCSTGPGCRSILLGNASVTADICCGAGESCYKCNAGYTWNSSACVVLCTDTCASLGYECDIQTICGVPTNCGGCVAPNVCSAGHCVLPGALTASITSPSDGAEFKKGGTITFNSSAIGGTPPYTYSWMSAKDGNIGNSASFSRNNLSNDRFPYNITLTVTDSVGATVTNTIKIAVYYPLAKIMQPLNGSAFTQLIDLINFSAGFCESKTPCVYSWASNIDGNIGNTQNFARNNLSAGNHIITLSVTDAFGQNVTSNVNINISTPVALTAKIASPVVDIYGFNMYGKGDSINFNSLVVGGTAPYTFSWVSDKDGIIGSVQSFNKNNLTAGHHIVTLTIIDAVGTTVTNTTELDIIECLTMVNNGVPADKIDVVFLGCNYTNAELNKFRTETDAHKNKLLSWAPFSTSSNKMNFYRIEMLEGLLCDNSVEGACGTAGTDKYKKMASFCPNDEIIILEDDVGWRGCYRPDLDMLAVSDPSAVTHEFGHSLGLEDEYLSYGGIGFLSPGAPNCDIDPACSKWAGVPGTGCFSGCTFNNYYRPTTSCMMASPFNGFCPVCKNYLQNILNSYP